MTRPARSLRSASALDGRVRRGERNREAIVDALFELVREGELQPTAEQVAERAGVGTRTVFRHFDDMESLHAELSARLEREILPLYETGPRDGDLDPRLRELVGRRALIYERITPFKRSGNLQRWRSPFLSQAHADMVRRLRSDLLETLPELRDAPPALLEALDLVTSFEAWDRLRAEQRLGRERAEAAMLRATLALARSIGEAS